MILRRFSVALVIAAAALVAAAPAALAHADLESSDPAEGSSLTAAPQQIQLKFETAVTLPADPVKVTGPAGASWTVGKATVSGQTVTAPVQATGPAGAYTINWTVIASDGDEVHGEVHFSLTATAQPSSTTPAPAPASAPASQAAAQTTQDATGSSAWIWIVIVVVVVVILGGFAFVRSRRSPR
ncbi:copper resistance CopC family protein [Amycolatopsis sp.]|uniref:copper resistance CopC family protein n=1 Tax=Amycolatopsis sp. TaxID=37632 RepID=UPI002BCB41D0|nr:copper resistance CopC family protein [Amycolatopsis sp.]HVV08682.1 copper resistance CopC family protein [Amycolatopsis sp.]